MTQETTLPAEFEAWLQTHCDYDDLNKSEIELARDAWQAAIEADRQRRGEPVAWRWRWKTDDSPLERRFADPDLYQWTYRNDRPEGDAAKLMVIEPLYAIPQPAEPVKLECPKCGVDRSKSPCPGNLMDCAFKGEAQQAGPVKSTRPDGGIDADGFFAQLEAEKPAEPVCARQSDDDGMADQLLEERDRAEGWADGLTELISEYFGEDVGEHSSANLPWENAKEILLASIAAKAKEAAPVTVQPVTARVAAATVSRKGYSMGTLLWTDAGRMADLPDGTMLYVGHSDRPLTAQPRTQEQFDTAYDIASAYLRSKSITVDMESLGKMVELIEFTVAAAPVAAQPDHSEQDLNMVGQSSGNPGELPSMPDAATLLRKLVFTYFLNNVGENLYNLMCAARSACAPTPPADKEAK